MDDEEILISNEDMKTTGEYNANQIQVLEGLEAVRKRPGMYIGSTSSRGLHHFVWEIVDNRIDEALAGFCDEIKVIIEEVIRIKVIDNGRGFPVGNQKKMERPAVEVILIVVIIEEDNSITVIDNGRGIPVGNQEKMGRPAVEVILTVLHAGGKFGGGGYKVSGGLHGVGASVVNALSILLEVYVHLDGHIYYQKFERGIPVEDLKIIGESDKTGTTIHFKPDTEIFTETIVYEYEMLATRIRELAFLNRGLSLTIEDKREDGK